MIVKDKFVVFDLDKFVVFRVVLDLFHCYLLQNLESLVKTSKFRQHLEK